MKTKKLPTYAEAQARKGVPVNPPPAPVAATEAPKPKRRRKEGSHIEEKQARVEYPVPGGFNPAGNPTTLLKVFPTDWDPKKHKPIPRNWFENEAPWMVARAERLEAMARRLREQAEISAQFGNRADRAKARRLAKMRAKVAELEGQLAGIPGVDLKKIKGVANG